MIQLLGMLFIIMKMIVFMKGRLKNFHIQERGSIHSRKGKYIKVIFYMANLKGKAYTKQKIV